MKIFKIVPVLSVLMLMSACGTSEERLADLDLPITGGDLADEPVQTTQEGTAMMKQPGMIQIQRHTPGYTISMLLDATDDNVYFVMDLPPEELQSKDDTKENDNPQSKPEKDLPPVKEDDASKASKHVLYAQTYFFERKYDRAMNEIDRSLELNPKSAVAYSLKGSVHYKKGEKQRAVSAWERSLELDPNQEDVKKMLNNLK